MTSRGAFTRAAFVAAIAFGAVTVAPSVAVAQTEEELQKARELFQEAFKDEQEGRHQEALEKFREVAKVKESASVRYRIAAVLEAMGKLREARDAYRALAAMKPSLPAKDHEIADSAAVRAVEVDKRIPKIVVNMEGAPEDARVTIDGVPAPVGRPIEQDPGEHVVQGTGTGVKPFEQRVTLEANGAQVPATVQFEADTTDQPPPPSKNNTVAYVALGAGGVLLTTGILLLVVREGAIDDIQTICPNNVCLESRRAEYNDSRDEANLLLPLGVGLSVVGIAAAGYGVYALLKKPTGDAAPAPSTGSSTSKVHVGPRFVRGGGMLGVSGTF